MTKPTTRPPVRLPALALALLLTGLVAPGVARSRGTRADAVRHALQARRHYDHGEYAKAIRGFERAYRIVGRASLLFNIADCHERLGQLEQAVRYYRRYLAVCAPDKRPQVVRLIAAIGKRPSSLRLRTEPPGAAVWINGRPLAARTPLVATVPPGPVTVRLRLPGHREHRQRLQARYGLPLTLLITLQRIPRAAAPGGGTGAPSRLAPWERSAGFVGLGAGLKQPRYQGVAQPRLNYSVALDGGYAVRLTSRARLELGARLWLSTINDDHVLTLLDLGALVGVRLTLWRGLFAYLRAGLGLASVLGVRYDSFFFAGAYDANDDVPASYATLQLWGELGLGYRIWRRVSLVLTPVSVGYVAPLGHLRDDAPALEHIFRYNLHVGLLVDI